jgi:hypothetical protein
MIIVGTGDQPQGLFCKLYFYIYVHVDLRFYSKLGYSVHKSIHVENILVRCMLIHEMLNASHFKGKLHVKSKTRIK